MEDFDQALTLKQSEVAVERRLEEAKLDPEIEQAQRFSDRFGIDLDPIPPFFKRNMRRNTSKD